MIRILTNNKTKPQKYPMRQGEIEKSILGNEKATKELGWKTTHSIQEGLQETIFTYPIL